MVRQRVLRLRSRAAHDWVRAGQRLAALCEDALVDELALVRIDDKHAVLVVTARDTETLARFDDATTKAWLADEGLIVDGAPAEGELVLRHCAAPPTEAIDDDERVARFVRTVRASGTVWGLRKKTWARSSAAGGREALPLWPDEDAATRCIADDWSRYRAAPIQLTAFLADWLPGMQEDGIVGVVSPTPTHPGAVVSAEALAGALRAKSAP